MLLCVECEREKETDIQRVMEEREGRETEGEREKVSERGRGRYTKRGFREIGEREREKREEWKESKTERERRKR